MTIPATIFFITGNKGKLAVAQKTLNPFNIQVIGINIDLPEIQDLDSCAIIKVKIQEALKHVHNLPKDGGIIVDDTSLFFDALKGPNNAALPGPLIKWFLETIGKEGLYELASNYNNFAAHAQVVIGYVALNNPETIMYSQSTVEGTIVQPRGDMFGWNPIFMPKGYNKSYGEMSDAEYLRACPRAQALKSLILTLQNNSKY